ncbi:hypothetical protein BDR26DRAFT_931087 [Obelidium mucronatum]|nr:hypothetical protein BDR26DRAFT_931087 [Obelidium mucronatum]
MTNKKKKTLKQRLANAAEAVAQGDRIAGASLYRSAIVSGLDTDPVILEKSALDAGIEKYCKLFDGREIEMTGEDVAVFSKLDSGESVAKQFHARFGRNPAEVEMLLLGVLGWQNIQAHDPALNRKGGDMLRLAYEICHREKMWSVPDITPFTRAAETAFRRYGLVFASKRLCPNERDLVFLKSVKDDDNACIHNRAYAAFTLARIHALDQNTMLVDEECRRTIAFCHQMTTAEKSVSLEKDKTVEDLFWGAGGYLDEKQLISDFLKMTLRKDENSLEKQFANAAAAVVRGNYEQASKLYRAAIQFGLRANPKDVDWDEFGKGAQDFCDLFDNREKELTTEELLFCTQLVARGAPSNLAFLLYKHYLATRNTERAKYYIKRCGGNPAEVDVLLLNDAALEHIKSKDPILVREGADMLRSIYEICERENIWSDPHFSNCDIAEHCFSLFGNMCYVGFDSVLGVSPMLPALKRDMDFLSSVKQNKKALIHHRAYAAFTLAQIHALNNNTSLMSKECRRTISICNDMTAAEKSREIHDVTVQDLFWGPDGYLQDIHRLQSKGALFGFSRIVEVESPTDTPEDIAARKQMIKADLERLGNPIRKAIFAPGVALSKRVRMVDGITCDGCGLSVMDSIPLIVMKSCSKFVRIEGWFDDGHPNVNVSAGDVEGGIVTGENDDHTGVVKTESSLSGSILELLGISKFADDELDVEWKCGFIGGGGIADNSVIATVKLGIATGWSNPSETEQSIAEYIQSNNIEDGSLLEAEFLTQLARSQGLQKKFDLANANLAKAKATVDRIESSLNDEEEETQELLDARRVRVRYLLEHGRVLNTSGNSERSIIPFHTAMQISRLGANKDLLSVYTVDAIHMLGIVDKDQKHIWTAKAINIAEKSKDPATKKWLASLLNNQGWNAHEVGEFGEAMDFFERALVERKKNGDAETVKIAEWSVARCKRSIEDYDGALEIQERLSEDDVYVCEERAILYSLKDDKDSLAREFAEKALAKFKPGEVPDERLQVLRDILAK